MSITAILRNRLIIGPPRYITLAEPFSGLEHRFALQRLVMDYLPEERAAILKLNPTAAGNRFIERFSARYFPIELTNTYYDLLRRLTADIPLALYGLDAAHYEPRYRSFPAGQLLAELLCVNPFNEEGQGCHGGMIERAVLTVLDEYERVLNFEDGATLPLRLIPEGGWTLEEIEQALTTDIDNEIGHYPGLLTRCRWLFQRTGNYWYDNPPGQTVPWASETVAKYTEDWPGAQKIRKMFDSLDSWLGHQRAERTAEVINFIRGRVPRRLMEVTENDREG